MPRKPVNCCEHGCGCGETVIVKSSAGDAKLLILEDKMQKKLASDLVSSRSIGGIEEGQIYEAGTSLEKILRDLLSGGTPTTECDVYFGALDYLPETLEDLQNLTKVTTTTEEMIAGIEKNIPADEQYVTIAYKPSIGGSISSITEDGFEAITDFSNIITVGEYKFYCTADEVYDPDAEIKYVIKWGIN